MNKTTNLKVTVTLQLPYPLVQALEKESQKKGITKQSIHQAAIEQYLKIKA
jgi:hypothetical protein